MPQEGEQDPGERQEGQEPARSDDGTQEPSNSDGRTFSEEYVKQLRAENASFRTKLKGFEDRDKTDQQKLIERAEKAEKAAQEREARLLRHEVAAAKGLPPKWAARLRGDTKDQLEKDADELLKEISPTPGFDGGPRGRRAPDDKKSLNDFIRGGVR